MKKILLLLFSLSIALLAFEQKQEGVGWLDIFSYNENSNKPRILIIGDSIVRQYAGKLKDGIKNVATLTRFSTSKSICSPYYIDQLSIAMTQQYKIILINNGLHDFHSTNTEYEKCYSKAIEFLKTKNPEAKIILMTTTGVHKIPKREKIVIERNKTLYNLAKKYQLPVIDLYSIVHNKNYLWKDHYHFKKEGVNLLSKKVIEVILKEIDAKK